MENLTEVIGKYYDGSLYYNYYVNNANQLNGLVKRYYSSGEIYCINNFVNDNPHGNQTWYNIGGTILIKKTYNN